MNSVTEQPAPVELQNPVSETALLTLLFKAQEMQRPDRLLTDPKASEILAALGTDLSRFEHKRMSQVGTVIRARHFDRQAQRVLAQWDDPVVVNLACGLDARFLRTDSGRGIQVDLDLPDVMALRQRFFPAAERNPQISASLLETQWMDDLLERYPHGRFAFIMEGVLMYLQEAEVRNLTVNLAQRFPGGELHFDSVSTLMAKHSKHHDVIREYGDEVRFTWGLDSPATITGWAANLAHVETKYYMNQELRRWGWAVLFNLIPPLGKSGKMLRYDIQTA